MTDFTLQDFYKMVLPEQPDTWTVNVRMPWVDRPDYYNSAAFEGYTSSANAIVAADLFSSLGEDIKMVFLDQNQVVEYVGQKIDVCIMRVPGVQNGGVRY